MAILAPMALPHIIIAVGLFYLYARIGLIGTTIGLVIGHTVLSLLYVVVTVMAILSSYDSRLDNAGLTLGASRPRVIRHVTLPLIALALLAAFLFAFMISFDELTLALFTSGGLMATVPKQMWDDAILLVSPTITAVSTVILAFVAMLILLAEWFRARAARR